MTKTITITLPDSGVELTCSRIAPALVNDIRKSIYKKFPRPNPPRQQVKLGGEVVEEENDANPEYLAAVRDWEAETGMAMFEQFARLGVVIEFNAEQLAQIADLRADADGIDLPENDKILYLTRIACSSSADMLELRSAIMGLGQPTEKAVAENKAAFPS